MFLSFRRIVKIGFVNFWRNGFVSVSSVVVMTITLFVIGSLIFLNAMMSSSLEFLKNKVDVNAYFVMDTPEEDILALQAVIENLEEVKKKNLETAMQSKQKTSKLVTKRRKRLMRETFNGVIRHEDVTPEAWREIRIEVN